VASSFCRNFAPVCHSTHVSHKAVVVADRIPDAKYVNYVMVRFFPPSTQ